MAPVPALPLCPKWFDTVVLSTLPSPPLLCTPPSSSSLHIKSADAGLERKKRKQVSGACSFLLLLLLLTLSSYSPHQRLAGVLGAFVGGLGIGTPEGRVEGSLVDAAVAFVEDTIGVVGSSLLRPTEVAAMATAVAIKRIRSVPSLLVPPPLPTVLTTYARTPPVPFLPLLLFIHGQLGPPCGPLHARLAKPGPR